MVCDLKSFVADNGSFPGPSLGVLEGGGGEKEVDHSPHRQHDILFETKQKSRDRLSLEADYPASTKPTNLGSTHHP